SFCFYAGVPINYEIVTSELEAEQFLLELGELDRWRVAGFLKEYNMKLDALMQSFKEFYELPNLFNFESKQVDETNIMQLARIIQKDVLSFDAASSSAKNSVNFTNLRELLSCGKTWLIKDTLNDYSYFKKIPFGGEANSAFDELKIALSDWFVSREAKFLAKISKWFDAYVAARKKRFATIGECSYSDVTREAWRLLRVDSAVENDFLYFRLDGRITHVLIDEFQDTNRLQYDILEPIISEITSGEGRRAGRTFFYVGDPKQSIYRFRGGVSALFSELANSIEAIEVEELEHGYRLFEKNTEFVNRLFAKKFTEFAPQKIGNIEKQKGGYVEVCVNENIVDEVISKVQFLLNCSVPASQIAVLCFKNSDCADIADGLTVLNIPVLREATTKLIEQKNVKAIIEWIKYSIFGVELNALNACKLFGVTNIPNSDNFNLTDAAMSVVFAVMQKFDAYSTEVFALLELSSKFESLYDFVYKIEQNDTVFNLDTNSGIRVLTVHKSKGLEFEFVILADRLGQASNDRSTTFTQYDGAKPVRVWRKDSMRESFDKEYAYAKESMRVESENDLRNALYVACTRGKRGLIIVQKPKSSAFEALDILPIVIGEVVPAKNEEVAQNISKYEPTIWISLGRQDVAKNEKLDKNAINLGVATHRAMEFWSDNIEEIRCLLLQKISDTNTVNEALNIAKDMNGYLVKLLNSKTYFKELAFAIDGKIGRIDLLILDDNSPMVIDYKSGISESQSYAKQLRFYKNALKALLNIDAKSAILKADGLVMVE
ncbi:MAG: hypothetical protein RL154_1536, partial [Pseudomonadota bacterium]